MAPTPSPTSKTTGLKGKPNKDSNNDFDIDGLVEQQSIKKRSLLVRRPSGKSLSTRSSTSSIRSTESNTSQSSNLNAGKKLKRQKINVSNETEKQSPVHIEQNIMGQNQSQAETKTVEKSDEKKQLETFDTATVIIIDSSSDDQLMNKEPQVVLTRIEESPDFADYDNMKSKHSKRKTPEDGFGDNMVMSKRSKMSRQAKKNSPQRTENVSNNSVDLLIQQSASLSEDVGTEAFANAMKDLDNSDYGLGPEVSLFADLEMFDPLALTADELVSSASPVSEYKNEAADNLTQNVDTIEQEYQGTSNMKSSSEVAQPTNGNCDETNFESDSEYDEMQNGDVHESEEEAAKQNGEDQNEVENGDCSENDESDDDAISIFHDDTDLSFMEAETTENTQSKRQMQLPQWKNQTKKTNEVPKLIPGTALTKGTPVPRIVPEPSTSSIKITRKITNNLPPTPSSRDPREQKRLMLAEKQNAIPTGQPSTSNSMQPPTAPPLRKPVKERLGLRNKNVTTIRTINTNQKIPDLMSVNPFATILPNPVETNISDIPGLPTFLPRDEPQGEILPALEPDNAPEAPKVPKLPQIPRVNIRESLIVPTFFQSKEQYRPVFGFLFEKVCRPFINDDCSLNPNQCQFNHRLPDVDSFGNSLEKLLVDDVVDTYKEFMMRIPKLFDAYFQCLASYFARKNRRDVLKQMIIDCDVKFKQHFFSHIIKCFMLMGDSYTKALAELIQTIKNRTCKTSHEIVKLILDGRNTNVKPFFKVLHRISEQKVYRFSVDHANRLLRLFDSTKNTELAATIFNITTDANLAKLLDQEYLKKFADLHKVTKRQEKN